MKPYFYKIQHVPTGKYYVGTQYGKTSNPYKFWKTYFTSSKYVKNLIERDGEDSFIIINIQIRNDARMYEHRYLKKAYNLLGKSRFLEIFLNRNIAPGILLTDEIISPTPKNMIRLSQGSGLFHPLFDPIIGRQSLAELIRRQSRLNLCHSRMVGKRIRLANQTIQVSDIKLCG